MRTFFVMAAAVAFTAIAPLAPAHAMTIGDPAGLRAAIDATSVVETVPCRLVRRCGPWGCGWRRVCWGWPAYSYYPPMYYSPRWYAPRPPWGWRYPYWRRW